MFVTDSNGRYVDRNRLKPESYVVKAQRFTTKEATDSIPWTNDASKVTDIIFQIGLNDLGTGFSPNEIQEKTLELQCKYVNHFPNARQHITALPPLADKHIKTNKLLQKLTCHTESNFISTKEFRDRATGNLRANMMEGIHYKEWGVSILSKEIMKSLYSRSNLDNRRLTQMCNMNNVDQPATKTSTTLQTNQEVISDHSTSVEPENTSVSTPLTPSAPIIPLSPSTPTTPLTPSAPPMDLQEIHSAA